ncbi:leucine-rich repeat protein soc-2 homolog isoform X1 [Tribolium madens]|uniref:leucine-rich repeat protein soc-2 homolog isoform X1 n=1 Tax=Tribolium madens TaxID=41895 RepID=UPI001CF7514C|nr:leucine-rich repeat protein soc-2 homolog isoform X1 [Tribolium madens]
MKHIPEETKLTTKDIFVSIVSASENNLKLQNFIKEDNEEPVQLCKLHDFFTGNFELSKITSLHLQNCDISNLPRDVQKLNLKQLILNHNKLKEVPSCLYSGLEMLEVLDLSHNLIETFDIEPACSHNIVSLKLSYNKIYNFPHWIMTCHCPKLIEIDYSANFLRSVNLPHKLSIKKLQMNNSQLLDVDFDFFKRIKTLEYLDVGNVVDKKLANNDNEFKDINKFFDKVKWKELKVLKLDHLLVSIIPEGLFWIVSLRELYLTYCDLSWIPREFQYLTNLKILDVSHNSICGIPQELSSLPNLTVVKAPFNIISSVADFANDLQVLDLYHNQLETFPNSIEQIEFIDLEQNYVDMSLHKSYETYGRKLNSFRQMLDDERTEGPKALPKESIIEPDYISSDGSVCQNHDFYDEDVLNERWDYEESVSVDRNRNPEITPSDDEWNGKEETIIKEKRTVKPWIDVNEDWIFSDVE